MNDEFPEPGKELDEWLINQLMPELRISTDPRDKVRRQVALETAHAYHRKFVVRIQDSVKQSERARELLTQKLVQAAAVIEEQRAKVESLNSEVRHAHEGRGLFENQRLAQLEKEVTRLQSHLDESARQLAITTAREKELNSILTAKDAQIKAYERDVTKLTTACLNNKETADARALKCAEIIQAARDQVSQRWGESPWGKHVLETLNSATAAIL